MKDRFCSKCGKENTNNNSFCSKCGNKLDNSEIEDIKVDNSNDNTNINDKKGNTYALLSLLLFYVTNIISIIIKFILPENVYNIVSAILSIGPLAGIVVLIIGRVNFPNNKFLKVVMWLFIVTSIIVVVYYIIAMIMCANLVSASIESCKGIDG